MKFFLVLFFLDFSLFFVWFSFSFAREVREFIFSGVPFIFCDCVLLALYDIFHLLLFSTLYIYIYIYTSLRESHRPWSRVINPVHITRTP